MSLFKRSQLLFVMLALLLVGSCSNDTSEPAAMKELLIYCGITMAHPITEMARNMEKKLGIRIRVNQGGSEDLYQSLKASRKGDIYLPGSESYRKNHMQEGLLGDAVHIGFNQAAIVVEKGNPKQVTADPKQLERKDLNVVICNPDSGSIGRETKKILSRENIFENVLDNVIYLTTDSRNLNYALKQGDADITINWKATAFFDENRDHVETLDLTPEITTPKRLVLNQLNFTEQPEAVQAFMDYAVSAEGQEIMRRWGFLDASGNKE